MDSINVIIAISLIHCALFFLDTFFKSCSHYPYLYFLHNTGFQIGTFKLRWFTTVFNRFIQKCGTWRPKLLQGWFTIGSWVSLGFLPLALYLILKATINIWQRSLSSGIRKPTATLEPMVPGINFPLSELGYYALTLIICSVVHEVGHAIAAVREDVHISGFGFILMFIIPTAYVELNTEQLEVLSPKRQLRILCAGVWHNMVLAFMAVSLLIVLPLFLPILFAIGTGVSVQHIQPNSPVLGPTGLRLLDKVTALNQCEIGDSDDWYYCLLSAMKQPSPGYCVSSELVREHDESVPVRQLSGGAIDCCNVNSPDHLCFEYVEKEDGTAELPQHSCLPARIVVESTTFMCALANDCSSGLHCLKPSLENSTRLVRIERSNGKVILFLGHPAEIYRSLQVSDYVPLYSFLPSDIPEALIRLCKYITMFSAGLAAINIVPCFYLDGQYIARALLDLLLARRVKHRNMRHAIATCVTIFGTCLVVLNLIAVIISEVF